MMTAAENLWMVKTMPIMLIVDSKIMFSSFRFEPVNEIKPLEALSVLQRIENVARQS